MSEFRMPFGKFKGERITRVPPSYLSWMITSGHPLSFKAEEELERRGTPCSFKVDLKAHAIDRASQRLMNIWVSTARENEGLYSWLARVAGEAVDSVPERERSQNRQVEYEGIVFILEFSTVVPVLKSVWRAGTEGCE